MWYDHYMGYKDKEQQRKFQRDWLARKKAEFYLGKTCVRCGSSEKLEIDHVDPKLKVSHNIWSWSDERRNTELNKCQILCHTCHWKKTRNDNGWWLTHGTVTGYQSYNCKCIECKAAYAKYKREYRARSITGKTAGSYPADHSSSLCGRTPGMRPVQ